MRPIATAVAALALVASAAYGQGHGNGNGKGNPGGGNGHAAGPAMQSGGSPGNGNGKRGNDAVMAPGQGPDGKDRDNGPGNGNAMRADRGPAPGGEMRAERGHSNGKPDRGNEPRMAVDNRSHADPGPGKGHADRGRDNDSRLVVLDPRGRDREVVRVHDFAAIPARGLVTGCPPGLAKKNPPCVPPGQVRGALVRYDRPDFWGLRLDDGRYRYSDGYLVRLAPDGRIGSYVPLLGGALSIGNAWPSSYQPVALPSYYESYYGLGPYESYRYADNVIYQVDPATAAITSIAALLTGDTFTVGQPMPAGYDVYNVPYGYRDQYYDTPDAYYRYSDGYVYQVDPETRLIAAAIELLAS
jgi:hypothetical protein